MSTTHSQVRAHGDNVGRDGIATVLRGWTVRHKGFTGSRELLEALPRHQTAHGALLADILDVLHGSSWGANEQSSLPPAEELSPGELRMLPYLPTNLSRSEIFVSLNTVNRHLRNIYAKLKVRDRSSAVQRARELRLLAARRRR